MNTTRQPRLPSQPQKAFHKARPGLSVQVDKPVVEKAETDSKIASRKPSFPNTIYGMLQKSEAAV